MGKLRGLDDDEDERTFADHEDLIWDYFKLVKKSDVPAENAASDLRLVLDKTRVKLNSSCFSADPLDGGLFDFCSYRLLPWTFILHGLIDYQLSTLRVRMTRFRQFCHQTPHKFYQIW